MTEEEALRLMAKYTALAEEDDIHRDIAESYARAAVHMRLQSQLEKSEAMRAELFNFGVKLVLATAKASLTR